MRPPARRWLLLAVCLLIVQWASRLPGLEALPLHNDEGLHLTRAVEVWHLHPFWEISDGKIVNHWPIALLYPQNAPVQAGRLPTLFLSLIGLAAGLALARRLFGPRGALLAGLLWIATPYLFFYERLALSDAEAGALIVLAMWGAIRYAEARPPPGCRPGRDRAGPGGPVQVHRRPLRPGNWDRAPAVGPDHAASAGRRAADRGRDRRGGFRRAARLHGPQGGRRQHRAGLDRRGRGQAAVQRDRGQPGPAGRSTRRASACRCGRSRWGSACWPWPGGPARRAVGGAGSSCWRRCCCPRPA